MSSPLVSIIIPAYKAEHFITRCLNSCIKQSYPHIEVIVINDCSPDSTGFICDQFALINTNIKVIHNLKNEGPQLARPKGVSLARGELITFLDSDDSLASNAVELLVNEAIKTNADIVIGGYEIISNRGSQYRTPPKNIFNTADKWIEFFFKFPFRYQWAKLYKKEHIQNISIPENIFHGEDLIFNIQLFTSDKIKIVATLNEPIYHYRENKLSISRNHSYISTKNSLDAQLWIKEYLESLDLLNSNKIKNSFLVHSVDKLAAAFRHRGKNQYSRQLVTKLYSELYQSCPKKYRKNIPIHQRLIVNLEKLSPLASEILSKLLKLIQILR
ncbi:glycosyltransferase [Pseudomonas sp. PDM33]|uniref:glycosyltransferase family 2 protein n=1 Tax=Pseudomonas sp. PDM33 TaxID=2854765 RepID=UPI001C4553B3|nr:glycosyltransferase family 2 protein [Pseudomonas sp. PDM33]MBV7582753.1 glycosyltransferase [Pseudomonas sp. PDM33]